MTSAWRQLQALIALRWQMTRTPGVKTVLLLLPFLMIWLLYGITQSASRLDEFQLAAAVAVAPAAFFGFAVLAMIAPLTAGGGSELVPAAQLVAYPVRPRTQFLGGLVLASINLVWVVQILVLAAETCYLTSERHRLSGALITASYAACLTVLGHAVAWLVVGLRQDQRGRRLIAAVAVVGAVAPVLVIRGGHFGDVLYARPVRTVVLAVSSPPGVLWATTLAILLIGTAASLVIGARLCGWALRRAADPGGQPTTVRVRRRGRQRSVLDELIAVDRASVWRAVALRRAGLVLVLMPGLVTIGAAVPWASLVILPGLVAAGAGLLFGINAFCLDGSGAVWLASLPHNPALVARAKLSVLSETVFCAVLIAAVTGSLRSPGSPTSSELAAIAASGLACGALVIATCMALSVHRPHRAELNGPRDAIAPPGALTSASVKLALPAGLVGMMLEVASQSDVWWFPLLLGAPIVLASGLWLRRSMRAYADPRVRARIVQVVAAG